MADLEADRRDVYEAFGGFIVTSGYAAGILELVETPLDEVAQPVEWSVDSDTKPAGLAHRDDWHNVTCFHGFANFVRVIATISKQNAGFRQVVVHDLGRNPNSPMSAPA